MVSSEPHNPGETESRVPPASPEEQEDPSEDDRGELGDVSFPVSLRGYDREAVDAYVNRVRAVVAELEATRSPEAAVKHALEQIGEQTKGILERAGETAEEITVAARRDADDATARAKQEADEVVANANAEAGEILARAKAEAEATLAQAQKEAADHLHHSQAEIAALREEAEARMRELHADTEALRQERSQLLDDIRQIAARVEEVASSADTRFPRPEAAAQASSTTSSSQD